MYPNGANPGFNPYPTYPTYLPQQAPVPGQTAVQLPYVTQPQTRQQPIPTQQIASIAGRVVQNEHEITPQEVSMDGSISLFPLADYSTIIAKQWNSDGTIKTLRFVPEVVAAANEEIQTADFATHFDRRMDELLSAVKNRGHYQKNSNYRPKQSQNTPKQEGDSNA